MSSSYGGSISGGGSEEAMAAVGGNIHHIIIKDKRTDRYYKTHAKLHANEFHPYLLHFGGCTRR
jgi:hypothetical protein